MYEQISHALLNDILAELHIQNGVSMRHFYTRLGANFYSIYSLFKLLYGQRDDFAKQMTKLVQIMAQRYRERRPELKRTDLYREKHYNWFLDQKWVAMTLYCDRFAKNIQGLQKNIPYFQELGINILHVMPMLDCPPDKSDGGYAVRDFYRIAPDLGTIEDVENLAQRLHKREMLLVLDVVVNHTSDEHVWAQKARSGDPVYQDYYYVFDSREIPDQFEETMPEIFPETAPGNFTWCEEMGKWVMTVFNTYQWDLNYHNPSVFIEMVDILLFWANRGADILRLDAVAFLWKKLGTRCQNEREAHLILQLMKDCCQVAAPGVLFIAEAIVAPSEIAKYFGEDAINAKECEIAYNATLMALLWDTVATKNARLLKQGIASLPHKLERATWLNYIRCHDDIGLGFDDADIRAVGYEPAAHRHFLIEWFTGRYPTSNARGLPFGENTKTGDARISGTLASLVGLEAAQAAGDEAAVEAAIRTIVLLHSIILSFGGIPLLYYGDAIGTLNNLEYLADSSKAQDSRWAHRSVFDWDKAARRHQTGTVEHRIFSALKHLIALRKKLPAFADVDNRQLLQLDNPYVLAFSRTDPQCSRNQVLVVANFNDADQSLPLAPLQHYGFFHAGTMKDVCSNQTITAGEHHVSIPALTCYWLVA